MQIYKDDDYAWEEHEMTGSFLDYKNPKVANLLRGYPGNTRLRFGVLFFDKTGRPFFVRHLIDKDSLNDYKTKARNETENHLLTHYDLYAIGDGTSSYRQHNANVISIKISDLDISDIKDQIGGFAIVRTAVVHTKIGSAMICPVEYDPDYNLLNKKRENYLLGGVKRRHNTYVAYSPELLFNLRGFQLEDGDKLKNVMYLKPYRTTAVNSLGWDIFGNYDYLQKCYEQRNSEAPVSGNGQIGKVNDILYSTRFEVGEDELVVDPRYPNIVYSKYSTPRGGNVGISSNCHVLITKNDETNEDYIGKIATSGADAIYPICDIIRENQNPYGGLSDAALANSIYITTGHFQQISNQVLSDIEKDGKWIFDEIQIFGGDTFINLLAIERLIRETDKIPRISQSTVFPCESRVNVAMREGNSVAKDLPYHSTQSTLGIRYAENDHKWEEFNYNDGYSSDDIKDFYLPLPYNWRSQAMMIARIRYSLEKSYGELRDSFRVFPPLQFIDLDINDGGITNIREKHSRLVYWQRNVIGYIPINERALTQNPFGQPIQLGIGGIFERHDKVIDKMGNVNQFGLIESDMGFHWFDAIRKVFISMDNSMQLSENSVIDGLDNFFSNLPDMSEKDNPIFAEGIIGSYDMKNKTAIIVFHINGQPATAIGFNLKIGGFIGRYAFPARNFLTIKSNLIGVMDSNPESFYLHTDKKEFGNYYGNEDQAYFDIIFVPEDLDPHVFDNVEITGNENLCSKILFDSYDKQVLDSIIHYNGQREIINRNWSYRDSKWYGSVPLYQRQRLINDYLKVRFLFDSGFSFEQFITMVKAIYRKVF